MDDINRYKAEIEEIKEWIESNAFMETIIKGAFERMDGMYGIRAYNHLAKFVEYQGNYGTDAFREARNDLRFFSAGVRNLS